MCYYLWTPYTDQEEEGRFLSINDGELINESLPWNAAEEPSSQANHVAVYIRANRSQPTLFSVDESHDNCAVCNISKVNRYKELIFDRFISASSFHTLGDLSSLSSRF